MPRLMATMSGFIRVCALAACADLPFGPVKYSNGLLTGTNGMTLYTFDKDVEGSGKSVCNGPCATNWPPLRRVPTAKRWRLDRDYARRRLQAMGIQRQAALFLVQRSETGRHHGRWFQQRVARGQARAAAADGQHESVVEGRDRDFVQHIPRLRRYARALTGDRDEPMTWYRTPRARAR